MKHYFQNVGKQLYNWKCQKKLKQTVIFHLKTWNNIYYISWFKSEYDVLILDHKPHNIGTCPPNVNYLNIPSTSLQIVTWHVQVITN